jgi:DNA helicase TIP49 (TBP-interacting protein)
MTGFAGQGQRGLAVGQSQDLGDHAAAPFVAAAGSKMEMKFAACVAAC